MKLDRWLPISGTSGPIVHHCLPGRSQLKRAGNNFLGWSTDIWVWPTVHFHGHWSLKCLFMKVQATFVLQSLNFHPQVWGENPRDDCLGDERLLPASLPRFTPTASVMNTLLSTPSIAFLEQPKPPGLHTSKCSSGPSSLTGREGRQRPIPCHHCKTRRALGPQPFSTFELSLAGGCLLFWVALYLEQYGTITQKNTVSQVSRKQTEQEAKWKWHHNDHNGKL